MDKNKVNVPKIRFPGFTDPWEQLDLKDVIVSELKGKAKAEMVGQESPYLETSYLNGGEVSYVASPQNVEKDDVLILWDGSQAGTVYHGFEGALGSTLKAYKPKESGEFLYQYLKRYQQVIYDSYRTPNIPHVVKTFTSEFKVSVPGVDEQEKVGSLFANLDDFSTLHQLKLNHLKDKKKGLLQKMFPKNGEKFPELRFPEFTDPWEQRKWSETVDISTEMVDPTCGDYDNLPHVAPGNIESFTGQLYDNVKSVKEENLISGKFHFRENDVIYGKINPQLGKYVFATFEGLTSADAYVLNAKNNLNQKFLFTLLQTNDFFNYSVSVSRRSGMPKINRSELNAYTFFAPCFDEQEKIGRMCLKIDHLITLHQRKLEHLQQQKKGLLQQMFI